ncbi:MAG: hypothetical protein HFI09_05125 [Bacilli bacterium]|nr:hypothetical protein [Bacilli bacterium]
MNHEQCDGSDFEFLIGKSIVKVEEKTKNVYGDLVDSYILTCKDKTIIEIETNTGCGGCGNGWSSFEDLKKLENNHNAITGVKCVYSREYSDDCRFKLFIYYQNDTLTLEGDDGYGNGYYGGGFYVTIKNIEEVMG